MDDVSTAKTKQRSSQYGIKYEVRLKPCQMGDKKNERLTDLNHVGNALHRQLHGRDCVVSSSNSTINRNFRAPKSSTTRPAFVRPACGMMRSPISKGFSHHKKD